MKPTDLVYPVCTSMSEANAEGDRLLYRNRIEGGLTRREHFALQIAQGLLSNPALIQATASKLLKLSPSLADELLELLNPPVHLVEDPK